MLFRKFYSSFITLAGTPATIQFGLTSFVTTAPAATIEFSPTVTPAKIIAAVPIQTFFSILIGLYVIHVFSL